ncbi:NEL-type E3 ubiquitin ligase domain-containing protein [Pseudomonas sp.]|uniref:NEL-type E3 ubiquitin ligase domain-containing protein n=1 Tax=Pseudomonas sp. TaxID=306 RepID=UPI0038621AA0
MGFELSGVVLFSAVAEKSIIEKSLQRLLPEELLFLHNWSRRIPFLTDDAYEKYKLISDVFANGPEALTQEYARRADFYDQSRLAGPLIAYVPDDPIHPLKEYPSLTAFMTELVTQLKDTQYQQFFSRFVAQREKPTFFKRVNERLKEITWHQREPLSMGPWWRETPIENPNAEPITVPIPGNLWDYLYREKRDKAIADSRGIAVPTGDENAKTRWNRLISYLDIGWNVLNFAAMLVPGMGEVVLGVMVAQLMAEFAEGIEDWSDGDKDEASAHINSAIINFAQLALMSAGHVLPSGAAAVKPSPFVDNLKPVSMPDGSTRMWNPDLAPYEHKIALPKGSRPDDVGLHQHNGRDVLQLEDKQYLVKKDPQTGKHRVLHPARTGAYAPEVEHNAAGAWKTELDRPLEWDRIRVLRRLNPLASTFSDTTLEQLLNVSGVDENALRRLHVEHELPPPLLTDTLERFDLHARVGKLGEQIRSGLISEELAGYLPDLMSDLPRWPETKAITLTDPLSVGGKAVTFGNANASAPDTLKLTLAELKAGGLERRVLESLDEPEIEGLLGRAISTDKAVRIKALREELAKQANKRQARIFESKYKATQASTDARVVRLKGDDPDLPRGVIEKLLEDADPEDLRFLKDKNRTPLGLRQQIRAARNKVRVARAYEGLYLEQLENIDTLRLELCSVQKLPGWSPNVRIEIRELSFSGMLQASVGEETAPIRKVLILDEDGRYHTRDESDQHLHGADNFYSSLLHALPDTERKALGYEIFQGDKLREAIQRSPLSHAQFEHLLLDHPVRKPAYDPENMRLRGGMQGYPIHQPGWNALRGRVHSLYPSFTEAEVESTLNEWGDGMAERRVRALENEFNALNHSFQRWMSSPTQAFRFSPAGLAGLEEWTSRNNVYKAIRQCWQRTGPRGREAPGIIRPQALILDGLPMDQHLPGMPLLSANFDHVTLLSLRNAKLLPLHQSFLAPFGQLRRLNLVGNRLNTFPKVISDMRHLRELFLSNNQISLTEESVARLRTMTRLSGLMLDGNPLGRVPDISQMPNLLILALDDTGIDSWPIGLFAKQRARNMFLDLRYNRISQLPTVAPGSGRAELIARTNVSREPQWLSAENLEQLKLYIESVGLDPERPYPPRGTVESSFWDEGITLDEWNARQPIWETVEDEFGSEPFFKELGKLTESADFKGSDTSYKADLTAKVWRMLTAMEENTELREKIFTEAVASTVCADGGTQFFNAMGVEVLVHEAYSLVNTDLVETELASLARGKSRLDELGAIARRRVADRLAAGETFRRQEGEVVTGTIDEVEVHLAYMTDLAERLDLPWQSRGMLFRNMAGVTQKMIEDAYQRILALEEGELLAQRILEQPFWERYLEETYSKEYNDLQNDLKDADEVTQFNAMKKLSTTLTQQAIDRAKLQRVEVPFTVMP